MLARIPAVQPQLVGRGAELGVAVGRRPAQVQQRARRNLHAANLRVARRHAPRQPLRGRVEPQRLLHEEAHLRTVRAQLVRDARMPRQQHRLRGERVLRGLVAADVHARHHADDVPVAQRLALELHLREEGDHVLPRLAPLLVDALLDVAVEGHQRAGVVLLVRGLHAALRPEAVDEAAHLRLLPLLRHGHVLEGEAEDGGDDGLRQRSRELRHELHLAPVDPGVHEAVGVLRDHVAVAERARRPHPGLRELLAVGLVRIDVGAQPLARGDHLAEALVLEDAVVDLARAGGARPLPRGKEVGVAHHAPDVLVLRQHEGVLARLVALPGQAQHGRVLLQQAVGVVPVLLRPRREEVHLLHAHGAHGLGHRLEVLAVGGHRRTSLPASAGGLARSIAIPRAPCRLTARAPCPMLPPTQFRGRARARSRGKPVRIRRCAATVTGEPSPPARNFPRDCRDSFDPKELAMRFTIP